MSNMLTTTRFFEVFLMLVAVGLRQSSQAKHSGCSANPIIPNTPFVVVWNHPTKNCEDHGVHLDFQKWGIVDNDRDRFFGQKIVLLYNLGKWPRYQNNQPVYGGLPQLANIDAHLAKVDNDLKTSVWNNTFRGLAIIDMEHWRPLYWLNFDSLKVYQEKSLALAKQRFPQYNKTQLLDEARREFDTSARQMMEQTLLQVTSKRATGKWGYYLYPRCWGKSCDSTTISNNDRMSWVFKASTGLYPSIYFKLNEPPTSRALRIKNTLHEAFRVKAKYSPQDAPVMPYAQSQEGPYQMFEKVDLSYAIRQPADMGSSGVVLWGSSRDATAKNECQILQKYIENTLGPYCQSLGNFFGNCTEQLCNGHGRCVRKDYEKMYQRHLRESGRSECLIPDDVLATNLNEGRKETNSAFQLLEYLKQGRSKDKSSYSKGGFKMTVDASENTLKKDHQLYDVTYSSKHVDKTDETTNVEFGHKRVSQLSFQKTTGNEKKNASFRKIKYEERGDPLDFEVSGVNYDFDDYVCKCYPGFSGVHCESSDK